MDAVDVVVDLDDLFGRQARDLVDALRIGGGVLAHRQRCGRTVLAASPGLDETDGGVVAAARFHQHGCAFDVQVDVGKRVGQAQDVVDLPGEVEDVILAAHHVVDGVHVEDVAEVDLDLLGSRLDVEEVPAVAGNHGVHDHHARAALDQREREVAADEAHATCDQHALARKHGVDSVGHGWASSSAPAVTRPPISRTSASASPT